MNVSILNRIGSLMLVATLLASGTAVSAQSRKSSRTRQARARAQPSNQAGPAFDQATKLGDEARLAGRLSEAVEHYGKALKIRPTWVDGWWYVAAIFYEQDRYPEARDAFRNVVSLDPKRGPAWGMLGLCEFQTREYDRAVVSLQRGIGLGLGSHRELESVVHYHAALMYIRYEQFEVAYEILTELMRVGNESPKVIEAFGLAILRLPLLPQDIQPDKRERLMMAGRAGFSMAARRMDEARAAFDWFLQRYPNEPNIHYALGVHLLSQDADAAMKEFRRELEISPNHFPAMIQMAFEHLKRDEYDEALPLAEKGVQLAPRVFAARNVLGRVLLELGQVDRAIKELEEGVRLAPSSPEMHFALARAYTRAGRKEDAARERELFKQLQDQVNARRGDPRAPSAADNQPKAQP